jgi:WD40 repeat protein
MDPTVTILHDQDLESFGVKWSFVRPDSASSGNSTSWKLRWSPDGKLIAVVYFDDVTLILDSQTGELVKALGSGANKVTDPYSKDSGTRGQTISQPESQTRCWGFTTDPLAPLLRACTWSPDGKYLAVAGDHRLVEIYDTVTWEKDSTLEGHVGSILSLDWSPDGTKLASGEGTDQILPHNQAECKNDIKIWDMTTNKELHTLSGHKDSVISLSWSHNSTQLVSASDDRNLMMWDVINGTLIFTMGEGIGHSAGVLDVGWAPNQTHLVSGSRDFKVRVWDARSGLPLGKPWKDNNCVRSTQWHPSGKYILSAGVDQVIKIRNVTSGKPIVTFHEAEETNSEVMSARWSPDGSMFATCSSVDATVRLYSFGSAEPSDSDDEFEFTIGIPIFFIIAGIGIFILYYTLSKELRKHRN